MTAAVGLVVPAYRPDVDRLAAYVRSLQEHLDLAAVRIELDASGGDVPPTLADLSVEVNAVPYRRGKGAAITAGFEALSTDVLAFADADGATPTAALGDVISPVREGAVDLAVGSRRHPEATVESHQTVARRYLGDGFAWLARQMLAVDLYDFQCGAKAIDAGAWEAVRDHLYEPGFAWDVELIAIAGALELAIEEVPVEWHDQPGSTVSPLRDSVRFARALVTARHRAKRLSDSRLHAAIAARREESPALVEEE
jgi:glycosyltransferase involved in cell wall biosynthesis